MKLFVSYARRDRPAIDSLVRRIQQLGHETWLDSKLEGGQAWWNEILSEIRNADAFVVALSEASVESEACSSERAYAVALGKTVVPVAVAPVRSQLLPADVASIQIVDYSKPGEDAAIELARSLTALEPSPPLPDPLPASPPVPTSYLSDLARRVGAPTLTRDEQLALVEDIRYGMRRARNRNNQEDYEAAVDVLKRLQERADLYATTAQRIEDVLAEPERAKAPASPSTPEPEPAAQPAEPSPQPAVHPPVHPPVGPAQPRAEKPKRSRLVTVLAVIGGIFVVLIVIGACQQACYDETTGTYTCIAARAVAGS
jgi:hypothetical protein